MSYTPNPTVTTGGESVADVTDRQATDTLELILAVLLDIRAHLDLMNEAEIRANQNGL